MSLVVRYILALTSQKCPYSTSFVYPDFTLSFGWFRLLWLQTAASYISRNILLRTPRFIALGLPSSYSIPAAPPSPDIRSRRSRSSASAWATDFIWVGDGDCLSRAERSSGLVFEEECFDVLVLSSNDIVSMNVNRYLLIE